MNKAILYAAAAATGIAGIIHLYLFSQLIARATNFGIFFLVAGILQLFWIIPTIRDWNRAWSYVGIGGTAILVIIWSMTRVANPITGRALGINEMGIAEETLQVIFIALTILVLFTSRKEAKPST